MVAWPLLDSDLPVQNMAASDSTATATVTGSATPHTKGAYSELIAATSFASAFLLLRIAASTSLSTVATDTLLDIAVGASGSEQVIVPDVQVGYKPAGTVLWVPIWVPAGARISARCQSAVASKVVILECSVIGAGGVVPPQALRRALTYGIDSAASRGVLPASGGTNIKGAWAELSSGITAPAKWALVTLHGQSGTINAGNGLVDIGIGASGSEIVKIPNIPYATTTSEIVNYWPYSVPVQIPAGSRLAARLQADATSSVRVYVAVTLFD